MHILFLTDNFPPEVNAPASRTFEHCREWVKAGHQVTVLTCVPNFPKGEVYDGYKNKLWQSEEMDGIRVVRVWSYITANEGFLKRTLDYISYMVAATFAAPFVARADVVVATSPHFFTAIAGYLVGFIKRAPFIFELRDLWPESIKAVGAVQNKSLLGLLEKLELFLYRRAARVIPNTESFKKNLIGRGIDPQKIEVVTNGVDLSRFQTMSKDPDLVARYGLHGKFVAGYVGTHGMAHALDTLLNAAKRLQEMPNGERFRILFLGDGAKKQELVETARSLQLKNVAFLDSVSKEEVVRYWSLLDVSIIHLRKTELFTTVIPSKLFETMAMGIPILLGLKGEAAGIVEREGIGLVFEPENADELANGLVALEGDCVLYDRLRAACKTAAPHYDRSVLALKMLAILEQTIGQQAQGKLIEEQAKSGMPFHENH
jgi:hypothetical protein